jgi:hypothetical protein
MVAVYRQARQGMSGDAALAEMRQFGFNPEKDTYLAYLARYVQTYMTRGALNFKKLFLRGDAAAVRANVRATLPAQLPLASKRE